VTARLLGVETVLTVLVAALWAAAAVLAMSRRRRAALVLLAVAVVATAARVVAVVLLAQAGWWFVQEKVLLALPLVVLPAVAAVVLARAGGTAFAVAIAAAAYGAAAGVVVRFVVGYPVTVTATVVLLAVVLGATAATALALTGRARGVVVAAAGIPLALAVGLLAGGWWSSVLPDRIEHVAHGAHEHGALSVADLRGPAGTPNRTFTLTARHAAVTLASGRRADAWTFDGTVPGPELRVRQGELVEVRLRNADIADGVTLHWHGYDVPNGEDGVAGVTQDAVPPGAEFVYRFRAVEPGTYWYHSHEVSSVAVRSGLFGTLIVEPTAPEGLDLAVPLHTLNGALLVGGAERLDRRQVAAGTPVRLRLVNTDDVSRRVALAGVPFRVSAVDGRDLHEPGEIADRSLTLAAGARYDVTFSMPDRPVRLGIAAAPDAGLLLAPDPAVPPPPVDLIAPELDLLGYGTPSPVDLPAPERAHTVVLDRLLRFLDGVPLRAYTVDGAVFPDVPPLAVREGETVEVTVVNRDVETHPMHLHGHHVLVLSRDGVAPAGSPLWLDTVDVRPGEVWRLAFRADNPGIWLDHCHNLPHATQGMVLHVAYEGVTSPYAIGSGTGNHPE
jgi:FtsP/CotA-like multicopper oxidase with cupredoxin domain